MPNANQLAPAWSITRANMLRSCPRAYGLYYHDSIGGWIENAAPFTRWAWALKKLITRQTWAGRIVHDLMAGYFTVRKAGAAMVPIQALLARAKSRLRREYAISSQISFPAPPHKCSLVEHYFKITTTRDEWASLASMVYSALGNAFSDPRLSSLHAKATSILEVHAKPEPFLYAPDRYCYVSLDLAFRMGKLYLFDWKTTSDHPDLVPNLQSLFAHRKWGVPLHDIKHVSLNLVTGEAATTVPTPGSLRLALAKIDQELGEMLKLQGVPGSKLEPRKGEACSTCPFQKICR